MGFFFIFLSLSLSSVYMFLLSVVITLFFNTTFYTTTHSLTLLLSLIHSSQASHVTFVHVHMYITKAADTTEGLDVKAFNIEDLHSLHLTGGLDAVQNANNIQSSVCFSNNRLM